MIYPYPAHVKNMIDEINQKVVKISPERKVPIYRGVEVVLNVDKKEDGETSPCTHNRLLSK